MRADRSVARGARRAVDEALARLEEQAGKRLGDPEDPLLVSVRSGARDSMPGMMDTVLNLGLNDALRRGARGAHRQRALRVGLLPPLVQMFGNVVCGVPGARFEDEIAAHQARARRDARHRARRRRAARAHAPLPARSTTSRSDPREQLRRAIRGRLRLLDGRARGRVPPHQRHPGRLGHGRQRPADGVRQQGRRRPARASPSRATRSPARPSPSGDFLANAQGEDVVSGVRTPRDLSELARLDARRRTRSCSRSCATLERHYRDMQDTEFTVEEGRLYMLQTRNAKRPAQAAVRFAVDAVEEGLLTTARGDRDDRRRLARRAAAPDRSTRRARFDVLARGVAASPGAAKGAIVFTAPDAVAAAADGRDGDPRAPVHRGRRRRRLPRRQGDPHLRGRQGLARGARGPRHGPPGRHRRGRPGHRPARRRGAHRRSRPARGRPDRHRRHDRRRHARRRAARDAAGRRALRDACSAGATSCARSACAPTPTRPEDARRAREFGAEGIGLCRTEHMFMAADRQPKMQRDDHGRRRGRPARRARRAAAAAAGRLRGALRGDGGACRSRSACSTRRCTSSCPTATELVERIDRGAPARRTASWPSSSTSSSACARSRRATRCSARAACGSGCSIPRSTRCRCARSSAPPRAVRERTGQRAARSRS